MSKHPEAMTTSKLKEINRSKVFQLIYDKHIVSKQIISCSLKLSLPTVTQNLKELQNANLIEKNGLFESTGGRKAQMISVVSTARVAVGVEVFKDIVYIIAVDLYGKQLSDTTIHIAFKNDDKYFRRVCQIINRFIDELQLTKDRILGVTIATQGLLDSNGIVVYGKIMNNVGVQSKNFSQYLNYPCHLMHDSKAATIAELWHNQQIRDALVILLNPNIGSGLILNGKIYRSEALRSGTIAHMCISPNGKQCYCGKKGCFEVYCSADSLHINSSLDIEEFFLRVRNHENDAVNLWQKYLAYLAFAIDNARMLLDCQIIISGFVASYMTEQDINQIYTLIQNQSSFPVKENFISLGLQVYHPAAFGAAISQIEYFLDQL